MGTVVLSRAGFRTKRRSSADVDAPRQESQSLIREHSTDMLSTLFTLLTTFVLLWGMRGSVSGILEFEQINCKSESADQKL